MKDSVRLVAVLGTDAVLLLSTQPALIVRGLLRWCKVPAQELFQRPRAVQLPYYRLPPCTLIPVHQVATFMPCVLALQQPAKEEMENIERTLTLRVLGF